jgi:KDO2-lipid IV(A) lauroyltransferase
MPKSKAGTRDIVKSMIEKRHVGILIDQKYNEGVPALFFGRPAMTALNYIQMAQKFKCPMVMARIERTSGAHFRISAVDIPCFDAAGAPLPPMDVLNETHRHLERWIRERPGQWLWLHKRWSEQAARNYAKLSGQPGTGKT